VKIEEMNLEPEALSVNDEILGAIFQRDDELPGRARFERNKLICALHAMSWPIRMHPSFDEILHKLCDHESDHGDSDNSEDGGEREVYEYVSV
jgi:hypothetical protein